MPENVVSLTRVGRTFGGVTALHEFSLEVPAGTVTALLGPNGSGKTTTVRIITGGLRSHGGRVRVFGLDPIADGESVRRRCGVVAAKPALYDRMTGRDNLRYAARLFGLPDDYPVEPAAARFGIEHALDLNVGGYSTGMKTRIALARAVLHDPELLLLDEPTAGLDPESARAVLELIDEMATGGKTVLLCTHLLAEAEGLADQVIVMDMGRELVSGSPQALTVKYWPNLPVIFDAEDRAALDVIKDMDGVTSYERNGQHAIAQVDALARVPDIVARLTASGVRLLRVEPHRPTLEDLYFAARKEIRS